MAPAISAHGPKANGLPARPTESRAIRLRGVRVHNLKNISLEIPLGKLVVVTGVSGSGKSSLALDTLYAEGQRRYVESFSAYARQFLERMEKPDADLIEGIPPAIALEQKNPIKSSRSTVGTITEIHDYLRLLFARIGKVYCPSCGLVVENQPVEKVVDLLLAEFRGDRALICFPREVPEKQDWQEFLGGLLEAGFIRIVVGGAVVDISEGPESTKRGPTSQANARPASVLVVADRLRIGPESRQRLAEAVALAYRSAPGECTVLAEGKEPRSFHEDFLCSRCSRRMITPTPALFSFNSPLGACPRCKGFGDIVEIDWDKVIPDKNKSLRDGAIHPWLTPFYGFAMEALEEHAGKYNIRLDVPYKDLSPRELEILWKGTPDTYGLEEFFAWLDRKKYKMHMRVFLSRYRGYTRCPECQGTRLKPEARAVRLGGRDIIALCRMTVRECRKFFCEFQPDPAEEAIAGVVLREIRTRLGYLEDVGLGYLTLDRQARTLSGGEAERVHLTTALGSSLVNTLYILDEPSIGLHPRDNRRLIAILHRLKKLGNTVVVVEHDPDMIRESDEIVDLGPGAGERGGEVVYHGPVSKTAAGRSLTCAYLNGQLAIPVPKTRRRWSRAIRLSGCRHHNLKGIDVTIPLGVLVAVTGVSGSGKSTLVEETLYRAIKQAKGAVGPKPGPYDRIEGVEQVADAELVDQSPLGKSTRSNPATYVKAYGAIRRLLAATREARVHGLTPASFSFNVAGGRCPRCEGSGFIKVEMQFLADVLVRCEECNGLRFKRPILEARYKGKNVAEILAMTVVEALTFFRDEPEVTMPLEVLDKVGLGYLRLGQPTVTLSGGEAQRLKLAAHIMHAGEEPILFLFDEPTTGLHFDDIRKLLDAFAELIARGHSVVVIEHNLELVKCADWVIDLGPEAADEGGRIVAAGTPEEVAQVEESHTGRFLRTVLS